MSCEREVSHGITDQVSSLPRWMFPHDRPAVIRYGAAVGLVALATLLRFLLEPYLGKVVFRTYLPAVMVAGWLGGFGPGLVATALSAAVVDYFWMDPGQGLALRPLQLTQLAFFFFSGVMASGLNGFLHLALHREREVRNLYEVTLTSIGDAVIATDNAGNVTFLNPVASNLTGWSLSEAQRQPLAKVFRIVNEETRQPVLSPVEKVLREKKVVGLANHTVLVSKEGKEIPIQDSAAPIKDREGNILGVVLVFCDDSERRKTEEALRRNESNLRDFVENASVGIHWVGPDGIIRWANKTEMHMLGYASGEYIGHHIAEFHVDPPVIEDILGRLTAGECLNNYEARLRAKDGSIRYSLINSNVLFENGKFIHTRCFTRDITERKIAEADLETTRERARQELQRHAATLEQTVQDRTAKLSEHVAQLEEFSYTVSHDLRSPLRTMQGYATAVLEDYGDKLGQDGKGYLEQIVKAANRMDRLTRDVLAYSKVAREHVALQTINLEDLVRGILDHYPSIRESRASVSVQSPLFNVLGNESLLTQAISNLLGNAVKFVATGIRPEIHIWNEKKGDRVRLWIKDNGIGIAPEDHARLFGMFERIHPKGRYEGTGIGLAIVRKSVERIQGTVGVESDGTSGSGFWIELMAA